MRAKIRENLHYEKDLNNHAILNTNLAVVKEHEKKMAEIKSPSRIATNISREPHRQTDRFQLGGLYFFFYDPKTKAQLPYYDVFPLVMPLEKHPDGFLGINLHYLPPPLRARLMDALYSTVTDRKYDENTALNISYSILSGASKYKYFKPCIKRYLASHVQSQYLNVEPRLWDAALFLPTASFKKANDSAVWMDSREIIGR